MTAELLLRYIHFISIFAIAGTLASGRLLLKKSGFGITLLAFAPVRWKVCGVAGFQGKSFVPVKQRLCVVATRRYVLQT